MIININVSRDYQMSFEEWAQKKVADLRDDVLRAKYTHSEKKDGEKKDNETDSGADPTPVDMAIFENLNVSSSRPIVGVLHKLKRQARDQNRRVERRGRSDLNNYT